MNGGTSTGSPAPPPAPASLSTGGMGLSASEEAAKVSIDRLMFFCDAVVTIAITLYALVQAGAALTFSLASRYIQRHGLFATETPPDLLERSYVRNFVLASVFLASIPLAFWFYGLAFIAWSLIPVALIVGMAVAERRHGHPRRSA